VASVFFGSVFRCLIPTAKSPTYLIVQTHSEATRLAEQLAEYEKRTGRLPVTLDELPAPRLKFRWRYLGDEGRKTGLIAYSLPVGWDGGYIVFIDDQADVQYHDDREGIEKYRRILEGGESPSR
jgi:hypothetical protein